ncbi:MULTISPECIES: hypothetical protein [unclassified Salinibacterium]|uniref:hypothetical protein n=1 Tax=unclassified Salinibacterium TaxID=2632331 RepID=UPI00141F6804|nr:MULTISPECIES: hypothetical protein [unclassified Salinibacterium]
MLELAKGDGFDESVTVLDDLQVSRAELESSAEGLFECFTSEGLTYTDYGFNPLDGWRRMYVWDGTGLSAEEANAAFESCQYRFLWYVEMGYELTHDDVVVTEVMNDILACLDNAGVEFDRSAKNLRELLPKGQEDPNFERVTGCANAATSAYPMGTIVL